MSERAEWRRLFTAYLFASVSLTSRKYRREGRGVHNAMPDNELRQRATAPPAMLRQLAFQCLAGGSNDSRFGGQCRFP